MNYDVILSGTLCSGRVMRSGRFDAWLQVG